MDAGRLKRLLKVRCYIKEDILNGAAGADTLSRAKPFVRHSTPHFDGTSRKVSYSVRRYHTTADKKSKYLFVKF